MPEQNEPDALNDDELDAVQGGSAVAKKPAPKGFASWSETTSMAVKPPTSKFGSWAETSSTAVKAAKPGK